MKLLLVFYAILCFINVNACVKLFLKLSIHGTASRVWTNKWLTKNFVFHFEQIWFLSLTIPCTLRLSNVTICVKLFYVSVDDEDLVFMLGTQCTWFHKSYILICIYKSYTLVQIKQEGPEGPGSLT